jgi:hypothetical protein
VIDLKKGKMKMVPGFRFLPSDDVLIMHYLLRKVRGEEIPWDGILDFELYGEKAPWEIFGDLDGEEEEKHYIFTRLKKSGKRVSRTAGCGTWHESSCNQVYDSEGQCVIGLNKQFCFKVKNESKKSHWIMHEFSLAGVLEQERCNNWVLCAVYKKGTETKRGVKRRFQIPVTIVPAEAPTPSLESPQAGNTDLLLIEDGSHVGKRMRSEFSLQQNFVDSGENNTWTTDLETNTGCLATTDIADYELDDSEFSLQQNFVDSSENNNWMTELEANMGCLPTIDIAGYEFNESEFSLQQNFVHSGENNMGCLPTDDNVDSEFNGLYDYLPPLSTPESEHLPLDTWMNICNDEYFDSVFV